MWSARPDVLEINDMVRLRIGPLVHSTELMQIFFLDAYVSI